MRPHSRLIAHQSKRFVERKQMHTLIVLVLLITVVISWLFTLSRLSMLSIFTIDTIQVKGAEVDITSDLELTARKTIDGNYFGAFSKANTFLYSKNNIIKAIFQSSPRIQAVKVERDGIHKLNVIVGERNIDAIICTNLPEFSIDFSLDELSMCYFADEKGYIFMKATTTPENLYHRYYIPSLVDDSSSVANSIISSDSMPIQLFYSLQKFYSSALDVGIPVRAILVKGDGEYEMYAKNSKMSSSLKIKSESDTMVIYFNDANKLEDQLVNLLTFWKKKSLELINSKKNIGFEYIDVRYGSNVFYREIQ